jgi:surface antigen
MKERMRAMLKNLLLLGLGLVLAAGMFSIMISVAGAETATGANPYPYPKPTYWAWQNRTDLPGNLGVAKEWNENATAQGWPVGTYPRKGSIAVFEPGVYGSDRVLGHVAVVERVYDDGTYLTSQMDEADCKYESPTCGRINKRVYPIMAGASFIHYKRDTRTTWSFASGAAGWIAKDLGEGNMGGPGWYYPLAGTDPQLVSPELDIPLDGYNAVEIEMVTGIQVSDPSVQVYFATAGQPGFAEARSVKLKGLADGQVRTYRAYFGSNVAWKGQLVRLRLDPAGPGRVGGVRVDRVRLVRVAGEGDKFTALTDRPATNAGRDRHRK